MRKEEDAAKVTAARQVKNVINVKRNNPVTRYVPKSNTVVSESIKKLTISENNIHKTHEKVAVSEDPKELKKGEKKTPQIVTHPNLSLTCFFSATFVSVRVCVPYCLGMLFEMSFVLELILLVRLRLSWSSSRR